jgi:hypothetical protein
MRTGRQLRRDSRLLREARRHPRETRRQLSPIRRRIRPRRRRAGLALSSIASPRRHVLSLIPRNARCPTWQSR